MPRFGELHWQADTRTFLVGTLGLGEREKVSSAQEETRKPKLTESVRKEILRNLPLRPHPQRPTVRPTPVRDEEFSIGAPSRPSRITSPGPAQRTLIDSKMTVKSPLRKPVYHRSSTMVKCHFRKSGPCPTVLSERVRCSAAGQCMAQHERC